jgi:hypothetical protein
MALTCLHGTNRISSSVCTQIYSTRSIWDASRTAKSGATYATRRKMHVSTITETTLIFRGKMIYWPIVSVAVGSIEYECFFDGGEHGHLNLHGGTNMEHIFYNKSAWKLDTYVLYHEYSMGFRTYNIYDHVTWTVNFYWRLSNVYEHGVWKLPCFDNGTFSVIGMEFIYKPWTYLIRMVISAINCVFLLCFRWVLFVFFRGV